MVSSRSLIGVLRRTEECSWAYGSTATWIIIIQTTSKTTETEGPADAWYTRQRHTARRFAVWRQQLARQARQHCWRSLPGESKQIEWTSFTQRPKERWKRHHTSTCLTPLIIDIFRTRTQKKNTLTEMWVQKNAGGWRITTVNFSLHLPRPQWTRKRKEEHQISNRIWMPRFVFNTWRKKKKSEKNAY